MSLESGKVYGITSLLSELAFKLGDDGKSVVGHPFEENLNQKWSLHQSENGQWLIRSTENGKYIGFDSSALEEGMDIVVGDDTVLWDIQKSDKESQLLKFKISYPDSSFVVGLARGNGNAGAHVRLSEVSGEADPDQLWVFTEVDV